MILELRSKTAVAHLGGDVAAAVAASTNSRAVESVRLSILASDLTNGFFVIEFSIGFQVQQLGQVSSVA